MPGSTVTAVGVGVVVPDPGDQFGVQQQVSMVAGNVSPIGGRNGMDAGRTAPAVSSEGFWAVIVVHRSDQS
jgi:hypothetical protein